MSAAQIGNWSTVTTSGSAGGDINVTAGGVLSLAATGTYAGATIGNGGFFSNSDASGNITVTSGSLSLLAHDSDAAGAEARIANRGTGAVQGDYNIATTDGGIFITAFGGSLASIGNGSDGGQTSSGSVTVNSAGSLTISAVDTGQARISNGYAPDSSIDVTAAGDITLSSSGTNTADNFGFALIGNFGNLASSVGGDINVTSTGGQIRLLAQSDYGFVGIGNEGGTDSTGGNVTVSALDPLNGAISLIAQGTNARAQIGNITNAGPISGNLSVMAGTDLTLSADGSGAYAQIGNGGTDGNSGGGNVGGDILVTAGGALNLVSANSGTPWIGNIFDSTGAFAASGDVTIVYDSEDNSGDTDLGRMVKADLGTSATTGGNVTVGTTGGLLTLDTPQSLATPHTLSLLSAGDIALAASLQNSGGGAINLVAGWDGTTLDAAHFGDAGVFANGGGTILVGGASASGDVSVGSTGDLRLFAGDVTVDGENGYAQLGYHGDAGGDIYVTASGTLSLTGNSATHVAGIGNGTGNGGALVPGGGAVAIHANALALNANNGVVGDSAAVTLTGPGDVGSATIPLRLWVGALSLTTGGGSAYLLSPQSGLSLGVDGVGVDLGGGAFSLQAAGDVGQTQAIGAGITTIATDGGAILLTNAGNTVGPLTLSTTGSDNASFANAGALTLAGATVGGTLTLSSTGAITQAGALLAAALNVSSSGGAITLNNAGNAFGTLTVATSGSDDASVTDGTDVTVAGAQVGGTFTLSGTGSIGQSGAILANALDVSSSGGAIDLTNTGNAFGTLNVATSGSDDAAVTDGTDVTVAGAQVGGTFTLSGTGSIGQSGAIMASALDVSSSGGAIDLTNTGNAFGTLSVATSGSDDASVTDGTDVTVAGAQVGGRFTLSGTGSIGQSGAIMAANALDVSSSGGAITLNNAGNAFGTLTVATSGSDDASVTDGTDVTVAGAQVGGTFTLSGTGSIGQSGAIMASALNVSSSGGAITLNNAGNAFGTLTVATSGSDDASVTDGTDVTVASAQVGGTFTLSGTGSIGQSGAILANALDVSSSGGAIMLDNADNAFGTLTVATSGSDDASVTDGTDVTVAGAQVGGTFTLSGTGSIGQSGTILANALDVSSSGGAIMLDNAGNAFGTLSVATSGSDDASVTDGTDVTVAAAQVGGTFTLSGTGSIGQSGAITAKALAVTAGGDVVLDNLGNLFAGLSLDAGAHRATIYDTQDLTVGAVTANGGLTLLSTGNLAFTHSIQIGAGSLLAVAGWDGATTDASALTAAGAFGNNGGSILIGGDGASGNVAIGASGAATLAGNDVTLSAIHGYAQFGSRSSGSGTLTVLATGDVSLLGGASSGFYAQIGHGGAKTEGSNSGNIVVDAAGDLILTGGTGSDAYAQIGHGGAESNAGSDGYSEGGDITLTAANATLTGGQGTGAYAQIGHGGYRIGAGLTGTATLSGAVSLTVGQQVDLNGGGDNAYAQIGHGGSNANADATASADGSISGDVVVAAPTGTAGAVNLLAGAGMNAYAQIGNGGYGTNAFGAAVPANFTVSGNVSVSDLLVQGGNSGSNAYAQIGNGDAGQASVANVSGDITIDTGSGTVTVTSGTATNSTAMIGNATGKGSVSGTITGYTPPSEVDTGVIAVLTSTNTQPAPLPTEQLDTQDLLQLDTQGELTSPTANSGGESSPIADLMGGDGSGSEPQSKSDKVADALGNSLDGAKKKASTENLLGSMLKRVAPGTSSETPRGVPPADADYSSWGNEAFWQ